MVNNVNIYFDFDMTLAYRIMMWRDTLKELLLENGAVVSFDSISSLSKGEGVYPWSNPFKTHDAFFKGLQWWERTEKYLYNRLLDIVDEKRAKNVSESFREKYLDIRYWGVFPDTIPCLERLNKRGYELFILSNHVPEAEDIIAKLGLSKYFSDIFISAKLGAEKPNPIIYQKALKNTASDDCNIMIGDNIKTDVEGALNNGFDSAILVRKANTTNYRYYSRYLDDVDKVIEELVCE